MYFVKKVKIHYLIMENNAFIFNTAIHTFVRSDHTMITGIHIFSKQNKVSGKKIRVFALMF